MEIQTKTAAGRRSLLTSVIWAISYLSAAFILKHFDIPQLGAIAIALVPIITFVIFLTFYVKNIMEMDEVKQRIQLEAVVVGFALTLIMIMTVFLLGMAGINDPVWLGTPGMVGYAILLYGVGYVRAQRKYAA